MTRDLPVILCLGMTSLIPTVTTQETGSLKAFASSPADGEARYVTVESDCGSCHSCAQPTAKNRCLLFACTRHRRWPQAISLSDYRGPDVVILDELENAYLPVPFDHRGHAEMAEMAAGCVTCHHYTPAGEPHPACKTCHAISGSEADIDKPALRGAYHQQCLNCHREWINERDCYVCHRAKAGGADSGGTATSVARDDILGRTHPVIPEPEGNLYRLRSQRLAGWQVLFRHREHTQRFGLRCVDCHHERSCARCHTSASEQGQPRTLAEHHRPCIHCHKRDMDLMGRAAGRCERCHWLEGEPQPQPFDHAGTGWPLNRYHRDIGCRACHVDVPFARLSRECNECHSRWAPSTFNHDITGQSLDQNHAELDCTVCHPGRQFDRTPTCEECHNEEDDKIKFPETRPGKWSLERVTP